MRKHVVEKQLRALRSTFGDGLSPVSQDELWQLFKKKDYTGIVKFVRDSMHLSVRIRVGLAKNDRANKAPAWVEMPSPMPLMGTPEFEHSLATIFLSKAFLAKASFEQVVMAIAHEVSHIVLSGLRHQLQREETAVDLTAMLLGYRDFYIEGSELTTVKRRLYGYTMQTHYLGYLTREEIDHVGLVLGYSPPWWKSRIFMQLKPLVWWVVLVAIILIVEVSADHEIQLKIKGMLRQLEPSASLTLIIGVAVGMLGCLAFRNRRPKLGPQRNYWRPRHESEKPSARPERNTADESRDFEIHRTFSNVFSIMSEARRQTLISYYRQKYHCNASAAMQLAVDDFRKESQRFG